MNKLIRTWILGVYCILFDIDNWIWNNFNLTNDILYAWVEIFSDVVAWWMYLFEFSKEEYAAVERWGDYSVDAMPEHFWYYFTLEYPIMQESAEVHDYEYDKLVKAMKTNGYWFDD